MISDYKDDNYTNIDDIEYIFGDIDNYYQPILASSFLTTVTKGTILEVIQCENYLFLLILTKQFRI